MRLIDEDYSKYYEQGRADGERVGYKRALDYVITRGKDLLSSGKVTRNIALGICLILGIAQAEREKQ